MKNNSVLAFSLIVAIGITSCSTGKDERPQPVLGTRSVNIIEKRGLKFKDLNKNGKLDKYEDWRLSSEERSKDLLSQMSVEEKAGFMLINSLNMVDREEQRIPKVSLQPAILMKAELRQIWVQQAPAAAGNAGMPRGTFRVRRIVQEEIHRQGICGVFQIWVVRQGPQKW